MHVMHFQQSLTDFMVDDAILTFAYMYERGHKKSKKKNKNYEWFLMSIAHKIQESNGILCAAKPQSSRMTLIWFMRNECIYTIAIRW